MDDLSAALEAWESNQRLFEKADGKLPDREQERLAFVGILPHDISVNVIRLDDAAAPRHALSDANIDSSRTPVEIEPTRRSISKSITNEEFGTEFVGMPVVGAVETPRNGVDGEGARDSDSPKQPPPSPAASIRL